MDSSNSSSGEEREAKRSSKSRMGRGKEKAPEKPKTTKNSPETMSLLDYMDQMNALRDRIFKLNLPLKIAVALEQRYMALQSDTNLMAVASAEIPLHEWRIFRKSVLETVRNNCVFEGVLHEYFEKGCADFNRLSRFMLNAAVDEDVSFSAVPCGGVFSSQVEAELGDWVSGDRACLGEHLFSPTTANDIRPYDLREQLDHKGRCETCWEVAKPVKRCQKCHRTVYCDRACQKFHWPIHKKTCGK